MKKVTLILTAIFILGVSNISNAMGDSDTETDNHKVRFNIPSFALLDIEASGEEANISGIELTVAAPTEAGEGLDLTNASDNSLWLNYSILKVNRGSNKKVTVQLDQDITSGLLLKLTAAGATNTGKGNKPNATGTLSLTSTSQDLITGIKSAYTGQGVNKGYQLTYKLEEDPNVTDANYSNIFSGNVEVTVTYTITD